MMHTILCLVCSLGLTFGYISIRDEITGIELFQLTGDDGIDINEPINNLIQKIKDILITKYQYRENYFFGFRYCGQEIIDNDYDNTAISELNPPIYIQSDEPSNIYVFDKTSLVLNVF